ncbi:hypothetical protein [Mycobacterium sp. SMC-4]|uniref:hypothetical protein n=1 Tax=Mycobacterium sp. SMC-4 TaxID=2857059 RepID=UPI003CFD688E
MALALSAHPEHHSTSERSSAQPLHKRAMLAGVAVIGASVLTVTPVAPAPAALTAAAQALDVQMAASTNPFVTWRDTIEVASQNIAYGLNEVATKYPIWLGDVLRGSPTLFREIGGVFGNNAGWQALVADLPEYGERIRTAIQTSIEDSEGQFDGLGEMVQDVFGYLGQAQFNNAFATVNEYFLWSLGAGAWPLFDVFYMPGQIAETLGADKLANVFDVLLTDNALGHYTESLLGPVVTAAFQFTEVLDDIAVAIKAGDWTTALNETVNMPGKVTNALLNGYTPRLAIEDGKPWPWVGLLTPKGAFETFFINLPRDIAWALKVSREEFLEAKNPTAASSDVSSTDLAAEDRLVAVEVGLRGEERKLSETTPAVNRSDDDAESTKGPESPETPATTPEPADSEETTDETTEPSEKPAESSEEAETPGKVEAPAEPEAPSETEEPADTEEPGDTEAPSDADDVDEDVAEESEADETEDTASESGSSGKSGSSSSSGGSDNGSSSRKSSSND